MNLLRQSAFTKAITLLTIVMFIVGCAANGRGFAKGDDECSTGKSAGVGALIGGLLGAATDGRKGALRGVAAGAVIGGLGCMAMNYHTQQVRSAAQVNKEYQRQHNKLPERPTVTDYSLQAPKQVVRGNPVSVNSSITIVDGSNQSVNRVEEKLYIVNNDGERKQIKSKEVQNSNMTSGGAYTNSFSFTPPSGVAEGNYRLESEVYVNNQLAKTAKAPIVLAQSMGRLSIAFNNQDIH